jgi:peroxiredoxin
MQAGRPPRPENAFSREREILSRAIASGVLRSGAEFPDGALLDVDGRAATLAETVAGAPAVVVFYRGAWCPYCNIALRTYRDQLSDVLDSRGIALVAISPQAPDGSMTMKEKHELEFAVLSDPGNQIAGALGILTAPTDEARAAQLANGLDLTEVNADGTTTIPLPTIAIRDARGTLVWIDVHPDYSTRTEPAEVLEALDALGL